MEFSFRWTVRLSDRQRTPFGNVLTEYTSIAGDEPTPRSGLRMPTAMSSTLSGGYSHATAGRCLHDLPRTYGGGRSDSSSQARSGANQLSDAHSACRRGHDEC